MIQVAVQEVEVLNELLVLIRDSITGYRLAASETDNRALQRCFLRRAAHRQHVADQLVDTVEALGGEPADEVAPGRPRPAFLHLADLLEPDDALSVHEVARGEAALRDRYERALRDESLSDVARNGIRAACNSLWTASDVMHGFVPALRARPHFA